ncbi:glycosyltransferase [Peribacillus muralis]|uniref:glycosyltransferase n=1 Tax=Peribacillus muralis TaxID=264697 RepID=UPI001F4E614A|nr:glycosyltransferase [Peribacillus muralis]MCK1991635.1 glycosyltransferase [Peribacillus muralis]MCK2012194.1 glycosyltransferase [Peribacillus muralis]
MELSFVVIGYNEEKNILRTLKSIYNLNLKKESYEVIYIDSNSKDNTIELVKQFPSVSIHLISSNKYSAALSRNIGSKIANGKVIFFLDGDMEIDMHSDIDFCLNELKDKKIGVISGCLPEIWYKENKKYKEIKDRYNVKSIKENLNSPGGFFLITKELLEKVGNFNVALKCNEEIELFSRVMKEKVGIYRSNKLTCIHHYHLDSSSKSFNNRLKAGFYTDYWVSLNTTIRKKSFKYYINFPGKKKNLTVLFINLLLYLIAIISIFSNISLFLIPTAYYLLILVKKKFDYKSFIFTQKYNLYLILGLFDFLFWNRDNEVVYKSRKIN